MKIHINNFGAFIIPERTTRYSWVVDRALDVKSEGPWLIQVVLGANSQLVSLPPVGILNGSVLFPTFGYLFTVSPVCATELNSFET